MATASAKEIRREEEPLFGGLLEGGQVNVGGTERLISLAGGAALAAYGLSRGNQGGLALSAIGAALVWRGAAGHCPGYQAFGFSSATRPPQSAIASGQGVRVDESVTILRSPEELYRFWRDFRNLPRVMRHLVSVEDQGNKRSHWIAKGPTGLVEWDAEIIKDEPDEVISWRTLENVDVASSGSVHFRPAPGNRGTEVRVVLRYNPPAGRVGAFAAWLAGQDPQSQVREDLRNLKRTMEAGLPTTKGQPRGR